MELNQNVRGFVFDTTQDGVTDYVTEDGMIGRSQYIGDILRDNQFLQNQQQCGHRKDEGHIVASIPRAVFDIMKAQGIDLMNDEKALKTFLNDSANRMFRTTLERV